MEPSANFAPTSCVIFSAGTGSCGVRGWCLSFAGDFFDKDVILPDAWLRILGGSSQLVSG